MMRTFLYPLLAAVFNGLRRSLSIILVLALLASNVLSLTSSGFYTAASGLLAAAAVPTLMQKRAKASAQKKLLVKAASSKIKRRTIRAAAVNVGSMAGEALPFVGWAVIVGATGYELKLACDNLLDLQDLSRGYGITGDEDDSSVAKICDPQLPSEVTQLSVWAKDLMTASPETPPSDGI